MDPACVAVPSPFPLKAVVLQNDADGKALF